MLIQSSRRDLCANGTSSHPAVQEPGMVHSSIGRLRVHLPHWTGEEPDAIVAGIRHLSAVTHAEANSVTSNVLILFEPARTSAPAILEAIPTLRVDLFIASPAPATALETTGTLVTQPLEPKPGEMVYMTGAGRVIYKALGWASVGMAIVGAILPGIPAAPFVILAGYFFIRSSPEAHQWLRQSRWFGPMLRDWEEHRGVRRSVRNFALALIAGGMVLTLLLGLPSVLTITIVACQVIGLAIVLRLRVVEPLALEPAPVAV
jgi:uncharacterized protein